MTIRDRIKDLRRVKASDLQRNPKNWRTHGKAQQDALEGLLAEVGYADALLAREDDAGGLVLIDGHLRADTTPDAMVPVLVLDVTEAEADKLLASLDPLAGLAGTDGSKLAALLSSVSTDSPGLAAMLDDLEAESAALMAKAAVEVPTPDPPKKPTTRRGDIWQLGAHRLICGDSTSLADVERLMAGERVQLCFTSPPYWVGKSYETQTTLEAVLEFVQAICTTIAAVVDRDGGRIVINTGTAMATAIDKSADAERLFALTWWQDALRARGWLMRHCRLWVKRGQLAAPMVSRKTDVVDQHWETVATFLPTFYCPKGKHRGQRKVDVRWAQQGVWDDLHGEANMDQHGAAFPVELPVRYMRLYSIAAESIFEPFSGTGTTIIAAEQLVRRCYAVELDPGWCDVAVERWQNHTGGKAKRVRK